MAAGDEKIDTFDQTYLKSRITDAPVDIMFDGRPHIWQPGEVRPVPRQYAEHFLKHATFRWDPTETNLPKRRLVEVNVKGEPIGPEDSFPLTDEDATPLDLIDDSNLPPRFFHPETGEPMTRKEGRSTGINVRREGLAKRVESRQKERAEWNQPAGNAEITAAIDEAAPHVSVDGV